LSQVLERRIPTAIAQQGKALIFGGEAPSPLRDAGITVMNLLAAAHRAAIYQFAFCREQ
jgi:hypothetical protein